MLQTLEIICKGLFLFFYFKEVGFVFNKPHLLICSNKFQCDILSKMGSNLIGVSFNYSPPFEQFLDGKCFTG
jgi:hypothetical protein